jgi:hypothetical protein
MLEVFAAQKEKHMKMPHIRIELITSSQHNSESIQFPLFGKGIIYVYKSFRMLKNHTILTTRVINIIAFTFKSSFLLKKR